MDIKFVVDDCVLIWNILFGPSVSDSIYKLKQKLWLNYKNEYIESISRILRNENVNYRIIGDKITDIIDDNQIESIEETLQNKYKPVVSHYSKAIEQLYKAKDYDNSIKESISTVESMCQIITGNDNASLGKALEKLKGKIHKFRIIVGDFNTPCSAID